MGAYDAYLINALNDMISELPNLPTLDPTTLKAYFDASPIQIKTAFNLLVAKIGTDKDAFDAWKADLEALNMDSGAAAALSAALNNHKARHFAGGADAIPATAILAAKKSSGFSNYTLAAASWNNPTAGLYTIATANLAILSNVADANTPVEFQPAVGITTAQIQALQAANVQEYSQAAGTIVLKAHGTVPTIDIPIRINVRGDVY